MLGKDYTRRAALDAALLAYQQGQLSVPQDTSPYFVGRINADRTKITDTDGTVYNLSFTGTPKEYELALRVSPTDAVVHAEDIKCISVDNSGNNLRILFGNYIYSGELGNATIVDPGVGESPFVEDNSRFYIYDAQRNQTYFFNNTDDFFTQPSAITAIEEFFLGESTLNTTFLNNKIGFYGKLSPKGTDLLLIKIDYPILFQPQRFDPFVSEIVTDFTYVQLTWRLYSGISLKTESSIDPSNPQNSYTASANSIEEGVVTVSGFSLPFSLINFQLRRTMYLSLHADFFTDSTTGKKSVNLSIYGHGEGMSGSEAFVGWFNQTIDIRKTSSIIPFFNSFSFAGVPAITTVFYNNCGEFRAITDNYQVDLFAAVLIQGYFNFLSNEKYMFFTKEVSVRNGEGFLVLINNTISDQKVSGISSLIPQYTQFKTVQYTGTDLELPVLPAYMGIWALDDNRLYEIYELPSDIPLQNKIDPPLPISLRSSDGSSDSYALDFRMRASGTLSCFYYPSGFQSSFLSGLPGRVQNYGDGNKEKLYFEKFKAETSSTSSLAGYEWTSQKFTKFKETDKAKCLFPPLIGTFDTRPLFSEGTTPTLGGVVDWVFI